MLFNFSFFGLKSLFVLYVIDQCQWPQAQALTLFATLMTFSYATSFIGGWLADQFMGARNTLFLGAGLCLVSLMFFALPSSQNMVIAAALLSLGAGCFKPNVSALLSSLLSGATEADKQHAFTQLYIAMNVGNFLGPLVCSLLRQKVGWGGGLGLLVVSFTLALGVLWRCFPNQQLTSTVTLKNTLKALGVLALSSGALIVLFQYHASVEHVMNSIILVSFGCFGFIFTQCNKLERQDLVRLIPYILSFALFCMLFEQMGGSLLLFFEQRVDRHLLGFSLPSSILLSLNPIFVLLLGVRFSTGLHRLSNRIGALKGLTTFGLGFMSVGSSFVLLVLACSLSPGLIHGGWVVAVVALQTVGELCIVPLGFAKVAELSPPRYASVLMSLWLMAIAYGHYGAGLLARTSLGSPSILAESIPSYEPLFTRLSLMAFSIALLIFCGLVVARAYRHWKRSTHH